MVPSTIAKINFYKFVKPPAAKGKLDAGTKGTINSINAQTQAINKIGGTLNSIAKSLNGVLAIQMAELKREKKKLREQFSPQYTKAMGRKAVPFKNAFKGPKVGNFWEGLLNILGAILKYAIIKPALEWLANPENQQKVRDTLTAFKNIFEWIFTFTKGRVEGIVNGLYDLFREDASWKDRLGGFMTAFVNLGGLLLALRWLSNPGKIISDLRSVLTFFYRRLTGAKKRVTGDMAAQGRRARTRGGRAGRVGRGLLRGGVLVGGTVMSIAALGMLVNHLEQQQQELEAADAESDSEIDAVADGVKQSAESFYNEYLSKLEGKGDDDGEQRTINNEFGNALGSLQEQVVGLTDNVEQFIQNAVAGEQGAAKGGKIRKRGKGKSGFIKGPLSGYPVSLDGKGIDFIGHGTEYVAQKKSGDAFVIPLDTAHTRYDKGLTDKRIVEALEKGYKLPTKSVGGEVARRPNGGWITGPMSGYPVSVNGSGVDFIGHGTEFISKSGSDYSVIPFHSGVSEGYTKGMMGLAALGGGNLPKSAPNSQMLRGSYGAGHPQAFLGKLWQGAKNAVRGFFGAPKAANNFGPSADGAAYAKNIQSQKMPWGSILKGGLNMAANYFSNKKGVLGRIGKAATVFTGPNSDNFTFGEKLALAAQKALGGTEAEKYVSPIAQMMGVNMENANAMAAGAGIGVGGQLDSGYDVPGNPGFQPSAGMQGGGMQAAVAAGKWMLSQGMTVMGHPNFRNNKWSEMGPNTGVGYSSAGREFTGGGGGIRAMGLGLDVKDYRPDSGGSARLSNLASSAFASKEGRRISHIVHDGWGFWQKGEKRLNPGSYGYPDSLFMGIAPEAKEGTSVNDAATRGYGTEGGSMMFGSGAVGTAGALATNAGGGQGQQPQGESGSSGGGGLFGGIVSGLKNIFSPKEKGFLKKEEAPKSVSAASAAAQSSAYNTPMMSAGGELNPSSSSGNLLQAIVKLSNENKTEIQLMKGKFENLGPMLDDFQVKMDEMGEMVAGKKGDGGMGQVTAAMKEAGAGDGSNKMTAGASAQAMMQQRQQMDTMKVTKEKAAAKSAYSQKNQEIMSSVVASVNANNAKVMQAVAEANSSMGQAMKAARGGSVTRAAQASAQTGLRLSSANNA